MNNEEENKGKDFTDYVKLSPSELRTLKKTYEDKIAHIEQKHWANKLQQKIKFDIRGAAIKIMISLMILFVLPIIYLFVITFSDRQMLIDKWTYVFFPMIVLIMLMCFIMSILDDKTNNLYRELNKIRLVLKNKESPEINKPNNKILFILKLLAQHPDGLNRADIIKLVQKEFKKSVDPKTIDQYLKDLEYTVKVEERPYKSKSGGHDKKTTKVYILK